MPIPRNHLGSDDVHAIALQPTTKPEVFETAGSVTLMGAHSRGKRARPRPIDTLLQPKFGEWLSLVEHLVRDQGVGGSNPLSPTIFSHTI